MKKFLLILCMIALGLDAFAQAKTRKLPTSINHPAINVSCPYMSFDGDALVFLSDNAEDYQLTPFFTYRENNSDWKDPAALPKNLYNKLSFLRGYTLGPEGKTMYITTIKSPGVGGYDIWVSDRKGASWTEPRNLTVPINTRGNEASPTVSPDGKTMYFMRCDKMGQKSASGCSLYRALRKPNGQWEEPEALPDNINTGNSQTPRILADGETLIFASDQMGGKGGMDLFLVRFKNGSWTDPKPLDFVNTDRDDQYVSVNAVGRYLLRDSPGARKSELVEYLIPKELRPKGLTRIDGRVTNESGTSIPTYITVMDKQTGKRVFNGRPDANGSFTLFLQEGSRYELSIDPEQSNVSFFSQQFDLTGEEIPQVEKVNATVKPIAAGDEIGLDLVSFEPYTSSLTSSSADELKRLARLIKGTPDLKYEIQVMLAGYEEDSVRSSPDLTEMIIDSVYMTIEDIDTLGQLYERDSVFTRITYHNDRTEQQAQAVIAYLVSQGIEENKLNYFVNARPEATIENRRIMVRARARK